MPSPFGGARARAALLAVISLVGALACGPSVETNGASASSGAGGAGHGAVPVPRVGTPCTQQDEAMPAYPGAQTNQIQVGRDAPDCFGAVCLSYHFQGRVTCPAGQAAPAPCDPAAAACGPDEDCVPSDDVHVCRPRGVPCQTAGSPKDSDAPCCADGSAAPVTVAVCGQCEDGSKRDAAAVFCTCRCGRDEGQPDDGEPLCACPDGFACELVEPYVGLTTDSPGKYCVPSVASYDAATWACGAVSGNWQPGCDGEPP